MTVSATNILSLYNPPDPNTEPEQTAQPQVPSKSQKSVGVSGIDVLAAYRTSQPAEAKIAALSSSSEQKQNPGEATVTPIQQSPPDLPNLCKDNYQVINCQYPAGSTEFPEKLCVFSPSTGVIRWYSLITADAG